MTTTKLAAAVDAIMRERCPHCTRRGGNPATCDKEPAPIAGGGWKCHGYRSRHWDEKGWLR